MVFAVRLLIFFKLIIFIASSLKDSNSKFEDLKLFIQSLPRYTSCLFLMSLNEDIVDTEKPGGVCSLTYVVDDFSGLFLHLSAFPIKDSISAQIRNGSLSDLRY